MGSMIEIEPLPAAGEKPGPYQAYRSAPSAAPKAAIIVIQEIFGVNAGIRVRCDRWAKAGYLAFAPDLFWRSEPGVELDPDVPEEFARGRALMGELSFDAAMRDIEAAIRVARRETGGGKVGVVGYCLGGGLAYLAGTRTDADAAVGYYGGPIANFLGEAHAIGQPMLLHFAEQDHFIDAATLAAVHAALDPNRHVEIHEYAGVDHGFATESGKRRDEAAATLADSRTADFFERHLA